MFIGMLRSVSGRGSGGTTSDEQDAFYTAVNDPRTWISKPPPHHLSHSELLVARSEVEEVEEEAC